MKHPLLCRAAALLAAIRNLLLPNLMSDEIRVNEGRKSVEGVA
jgi:hypothetical protein